MKKIKIILTGILFLSIVSAQAQTAYEWDEYGVAFELADDFETVTDNRSAWELISNDDQVFISVMPWSDASVTVDDLEEATYLVAVDLVFDDGAEVDGDCVEIDDFDVCYVIGGVYNRDWDYYLVALMMDVNSETNLQVAVAFNEGDVDEVIDILNSFYAYN